MQGLSYRSATIDDLDCVATAIIEAERSCTDRTTYERVFGLSSAELVGVLRGLLSEDIPGSELCCSSFVLAMAGDTAAGCVATWIEACGNLPSNLVRASLLIDALGDERWRQAQRQLALLGEIDIKREPGALQIEGVYVAPLPRGRGVFNATVEHAIARCRADHPEVGKAQMISVAENKAAFDAFSKSGFVVAQRTHSDNPEIASLFPGTGRLLWERIL